MKVEMMKLTDAATLKGGNQTSHVLAREYEIGFDPTGNGVTVSWGGKTVFLPWHMVREVHYTQSPAESGRIHGGGYQLEAPKEPVEVAQEPESKPNQAMEKPLFPKRGRPPKHRG